MNSKTLKRQRELKQKLMAAISMLLVSSLMMVTSTYAWFTLSTAPEVTGITTAVGANGNLEMALLPIDGTTATIDANSGVGDAINEDRSNVAEANVTWGNLVDLSDTTVYGLDKITLFPSALNLEDDGKTIGAALLTTPQYGADGRISELAKNTLTGVYSQNAFTPDEGNNTSYGVRAVGTASGMTDRQLDYRNARSAANTARTQAASSAATALSSNGSALANIAIQYGMNGVAAEFKAADLASLRAIINALNGDSGVFELIEKAYMQYILAYAASSQTGTEDTAWLGIKGLVEATDATLSSVQAGLTTHSVTLPGTAADMITDYNDMVAAVAEADTELKGLEEQAEANPEKTFTWAEIKTAMEPLVNPSMMKINGFLASEVKDNISDLVSSVTSQGGLTVVMESGAGVFADIADHTEDYQASVNIEKVEYNGVALNNMAARMKTDSEKAPNYNLVVLGEAVTAAGAPASGAQGTMPITDMYGYVIDLAFRTNAAESNLLLQQKAVDRIYSDNTNEDTMGHGATMTFKATTPDFTDDQVKTLMSAIRIVFFDPGTKNVVTYAKLDAANATFDTNGWTAKICLYEKTEGGTQYKPTTYDPAATGVIYYAQTSTTTYTAVEGVNASNFDSYTNLYTKNGEEYIAVGSDATYVEGTTYYAGNTTASYEEITDFTGLTEGAPVYVKETATDGETLKTDNVIMPLSQNLAQRLSVLVYLDGTKVTNGSVAATAATSMTGSMNLQFASSATLVPMDYANLHTPGTTNTQPETNGAEQGTEPATP